MIKLESQLNLARCPHCNIAKPNIVQVWATNTTDYNGQNARNWIVYECSSCGGLVTAYGLVHSPYVYGLYPSHIIVDESVPSKAKNYLEQAIESLHSPAGAVMLTASSVDAMLKEKGYKEGSLYVRINKASQENVITKDMASWAHQVRLDANDQRHSDEDADLPTEDDAKKSIDFAQALAQFLFVLPTRVTRGLTESK